VEDETKIRTAKFRGGENCKDIQRATCKRYSAQKKIGIILDGLRGEDSIAELYSREGKSQGLY
jgi:transposase